MIRTELIKHINDYGDVELSPDLAFEYILHGENISGARIKSSDEIDLYDSVLKRIQRDQFPMLLNEKKYTKDPEKYLKIRSKTWNVPSEYMNMDIVSYLIEKCSNKEEKDRVTLELLEFEKRKEINILRVMVFVVDQFRKNNVLWGIGRGSSVSSFCLYLIGINKINPLKYDIPYTDFFR